MPPKPKKDNKSKASESATPTQSVPTATTDNTYFGSTESIPSPRCINLSMLLLGNPPTHGEYLFFALFNGIVLIEGRWQDDTVYETETLPIDLKDPYMQRNIAAKPLILLLRATGGKGSKDPDPLCHPENRAGACVDLFPLLLGEEEVFTNVRLISPNTGEPTNCSVEVHAISPGTKDDGLVSLMITMLSIHCLPQARDNTVYMSAIGLNGLQKPKAVNFNRSLSTADAKKVVWATASTGGLIANTEYNIRNDDVFVPNDLNPQTGPECRSFYWNAMKRFLVDPELLRERLASPFLLDVAGVPRTGKLESRGRFMGLVDAQVLLEPGQRSVTLCTKLSVFIEANTPDHIGPLLELPPTSAKASARGDTDQILDEFGHKAYTILRFDLMEPLVFKLKIAALYETIGFPLSKSPQSPQTVEQTNKTPEETVIDSRQIRKEGGALAVHKELSGLACKGAVPMNQGIKRTAANRLLMRVRAMLKSFPPGDCSYIDWQDTVTGQHAASRRAVTASFAPQPPEIRIPGKVAAARSRIAGDTRIAEQHVKTNLQSTSHNPRSFLSKTLRCLEERNDLDARNYLMEALSIEARNRYLLWILGAIEFDQEPELADIAGAALRIAVKGDTSDGTANAIGWAALHAFHHYHGNIHAAFVAAKKMRKCFSLPKEWSKILDRWVETSGEEEIYWSPSVIESENPILIAAAFFLCLKCYKLAERLLQCVEEGCATRGCFKWHLKVGPDVFYIRAASLVLRNQFDSAMEMTLEGIKTFGPSPMMAQMRVTCLTCIRDWDRECQRAIVDSEKAGAQLCTSLLYKSALSMFKTNPKEALQRAARAHKQAPSAFTALLIGRIQARLGEDWLAERWLAAAVKMEPLLADGWAMLCLLAMYDSNLAKARAMLRTARQVGPVSPDIESELTKVMEMVKLDRLPDFLVKNLCLCDYF